VAIPLHHGESRQAGDCFVGKTTLLAMTVGQTIAWISSHIERYQPDVYQF
jgi:hypothetical protein